MSKLHIIFKLNLDLFDKSNDFIERISLPLPKGSLEKVAPKSVERKINLRNIQYEVESELILYNFPWIRQIFQREFEIITCGFGCNNYCYHLWIESKDGKRIRSEELSKALFDADPNRGGKDRWLKSTQNSILDQEDLEGYDLGRIGLVPEVKEVLLVTEQKVHIDKLAGYN